MPTPAIPFDQKNQIHFQTFTIVNWINLFTSDKYFKILLNALKFYQKEINLKIYGFVFMFNHAHLIAQCHDMIRFTRCFKSYSARKIIETLKLDKKESILSLLKSEKPDQNFQIWKRGSYPKVVETEEFFQEKLNYIHENPVVAGYVEREEDWKYSSAKNYYCDDHSLIKVITE